MEFVCFRSDRQTSFCERGEVNISHSALASRRASDLSPFPIPPWAHYVTFANSISVYVGGCLYSRLQADSRLPLPCTPHLTFKSSIFWIPNIWRSQFGTAWSMGWARPSASIKHLFSWIFLSTTVPMCSMEQTVQAGSEIIKQDFSECVWTEDSEEVKNNGRFFGTRCTKRTSFLEVFLWEKGSCRVTALISSGWNMDVSNADMWWGALSLGSFQSRAWFIFSYGQEEMSSWLEDYKLSIDGAQGDCLGWTPSLKI